MVCDISGIDEVKAEKMLEDNSWSVYDVLKALEK